MRKRSREHRIPGVSRITLQMHWLVGLIFAMFALHHQSGEGGGLQKGSMVKFV